MQVQLINVQDLHLLRPKLEFLICLYFTDRWYVSVLSQIPVGRIPISQELQKGAV